MTAPRVTNTLSLHFPSARICSSSNCRLKTEYMSSFAIGAGARGTGKWMENIFFWYLPYRYRPYNIYIAITRHNDLGAKKRNGMKRKGRKKHIKNKGKKKSSGYIFTHLCRESMYIYNLYLRIRMRCARNAKFV